MRARTRGNTLSLTGEAMGLNARHNSHPHGSRDHDREDEVRRHHEDREVPKDNATQAPKAKKLSALDARREGLVDAATR